MYKIGKYIPSDLMIDLICKNYPMLLVVGRFGIDIGFGDDTIEEVCIKSNVDIDTFLSVVNLLISDDKHGYKVDYSSISLPAMVQYLSNSHSYFLDYRLPVIRRELVESLDRNDDAVSIVVVKYFDEYVTEVHRHMRYEEETLFPYISSIVEGNHSQQYSVDIYSKHHDKIEVKLTELKNIILKYYPAKTTNCLTNVLYDIFSCERDLASHNDIEDLLLVPTIKHYENI